MSNLIKIVDHSRLNNEIEYLTKTKTNFERGIKKLLANDLPISVEWLKKIKDEAELKQFLFDSMNKTFHGYVPASTRARLKMEYSQVATECARDVEYCSSVVRSSSYVIMSDKSGSLCIDEEATKKKIESQCYIFLDADKISKGATNLINLERALREFNEESLKVGLPVPDQGLAFYNDYGTCGQVDWHWLIDTLRSKPNLTQEEAEALSSRLYRFNCKVMKDDDEA